MPCNYLHNLSANTIFVPWRKFKIWMKKWKNISIVTVLNSSRFCFRYCESVNTLLSELMFSNDLYRTPNNYRVLSSTDSLTHSSQDFSSVIHYYLKSNILPNWTCGLKVWEYNPDVIMKGFKTLLY